MPRILIVEDDQAIAIALEDDLRMEGYAVEVTHDGETAIRRGRGTVFDLILLDVMLPRKDGFEVGLSFNQAPAKLFIPFAAITGFHDPAVNFALQFQAQSEEGVLDEHEAAENDPPVAEPIEDGSNVVSVDFSRKK